MIAPKKFRIAPNSICPICGTSFYAEPNRIKKSINGQVYCSKACSEQASIGRQTRKRNRHSLICKNCGSPFEVQNSRLFNGSHPQFCNHQCEAEFRHKEAVARNTRTCAQCGQTFSRDATSLRKTEEITGGKVYCSSACSFAANGSRGKNRLEIDFHAAFPGLEYTGDGSWVLHDEEGGMLPDFRLPGTNKIIELFGNYWHANENPEIRIERLRKLGYAAIVIWENDFRGQPEDTIEQVRRFLEENDGQ